MRFATEIWLPRSRDEIFQFFSDAANLEALTPPWLNFQILTPSIVLRPGVRIDYRLRLYGIALRWQSEISRWEPPEHFVDEQRHARRRRGRFRGAVPVARRLAGDPRRAPHLCLSDNGAAEAVRRAGPCG